MNRVIGVTTFSSQKKRAFYIIVEFLKNDEIASSRIKTLKDNILKQTFRKAVVMMSHLSHRKPDCNGCGVLSDKS